MPDIIKIIETANGEALNHILNAVLSRYGILYPGWEISTVSILCSEDRNEQLDRMIAMLEKMKTL